MCVAEGLRVWLRKALARQRLKRTRQGKLRAESDLDMLRILVDSIMEYAIIMLDPKGNMVSWSPAAERLKGYSAVEVVGKNFSIFSTTEDATSGKTDSELKTAVREGQVRGRRLAGAQGRLEILGQRCHHRVAGCRRNAEGLRHGHSRPQPAQGIGRTD